MAQAAKTPVAIVAFDFTAFESALSALEATRSKVKDAAKAAKLSDGKAFLALLSLVADYGVATYDLQPLALLVKRAKPSALGKRVIAALFPSHEMVVRVADKSLGFVVRDGFAKTYDLKVWDVVSSAAKSGDTLDCDQVKAACPAPKASNQDKVDALRKALAAKVKAGLSKADIADILKDL